MLRIGEADGLSPCCCSADSPSNSLIGLQARPLQRHQEEAEGQAQSRTQTHPVRLQITPGWCRNRRSPVVGPGISENCRAGKRSRRQGSNGGTAEGCDRSRHPAALHRDHQAHR